MHIPAFLKRIAALLLVVCLGLPAAAAEPEKPTPPDEGMWIPLLISKNIPAMKRLGFKLSAEDIYNVNNGSLKDAVVSLGGFCTAEVISDQGLLLTNHHCAYDGIQTLSVQDDANYLDDGFWAMSQEEEKVVPGLTVSFLQRIVDVTDDVNARLEETESQQAREVMLQTLAEEYKSEYSEDGTYRVDLETMFFGAEHYVFVYKVYRDVRLVGAPPEAIGKFGGDTDNWMWPRHTGDFSLLRVYANADNEPADYSPDNVPYQPKRHLKVANRPLEEGDFAMIMGYPGRTNRYLTSYDIEQRQLITNPARVELRRKRLDIMDSYMQNDPDIRLKLASKYAQIANYWKYFKGQIRGLRQLETVKTTQQFEQEFRDWVNENEERRETYEGIFDEFQATYEQVEPYQIPYVYLLENVLGTEAMLYSFRYTSLMTMLEDYDEKDASEEERAAVEQMLKQMEGGVEEHFKNYVYEVDRDIFIAMMRMYHENVPTEYQPELFQDLVRKYRSDFEKMARKIFDKSIFVSQAEMRLFFEKPKYKTLKKDPLLELTNAFLNTYRQNVAPPRQMHALETKRLSRLYVQGMREMFPDSTFYPDANSTMRLTYGTVKPYRPADAVFYDWFTTSEGIEAKYNPKDPEFNAPEKLMDLIDARAFGDYANPDGTMPVCFITTNDITGGNSGSPVMGAEGELIGLAFDGNWEDMTGDLVFTAPLKRTICVDIRYVLFVIDRFAGAGHLVKEMDLVTE